MGNISKINIINSSRIMRLIWQKPGISRIEIAEELNLDRSTITKIMNSITNKQWVTSFSKENSRENLGRKPVGLQINPLFGVIIGIEVKTQSFTSVAIDLCGNILLSETTPFDPNSESFYEVVVTAFNSAKKSMSEKNLKVLMTGVGLPGIVDPFSGILKLSNPLGIYEPVYIAKKIEELINTPVLIENDANCCCWGELVHKKEKIDDSFLGILGEFRRTDLEDPPDPGIAIGLGIVMDGKVYYGNSFSAGEFRSVDWKSGNKTQFSIENRDSYNLRDKSALLKKVFYELARNLSMLINTFDIHKVVFTADFSDYRHELEQVFREAVAYNWVYSNIETRKILIEFSSLKQNAVAYGAACNALSRIFSIPQIGPESNMRGTTLLNHLTDRV